VGELKDAGLKVTAEEQESDQPKGRVMSQSPPGGSTVDRGSRVTITVSKGQPQVAVPNVIGQNEENARAALEDAGFKVKVTKKESADQPDGTVLSQRPASGDRPKGSTVTIVVASTPPADGTPQGTGISNGQGSP
jgi:serine/threonine-protein kinase